MSAGSAGACTESTGGCAWPGTTQRLTYCSQFESEAHLALVELGEAVPVRLEDSGRIAVFSKNDGARVDRAR